MALSIPLDPIFVTWTSILFLKFYNTLKKTLVTEFGWSTALVGAQTQANNLKTAYTAFRNTSYVFSAYWNSVQDVPEANGYWGLQTGGSAADNYVGTVKPSFSSYQKHANY